MKHLDFLSVLTAAAPLAGKDEASLQAKVPTDTRAGYVKDRDADSRFTD